MGQKVYVRQNKWLGIIPALLISLAAFSQPDCRSIIGSHLTPVANSGLYWAVEGTMAAGVMPDREIANWSAYGAIDYSKNKWQFYFEGAYKDWYNSALNPDGEEVRSTMTDFNKPARYHWGVREGYLKYGRSADHLKLGIQSYKSSDYLLFDERMMGASMVKNYGALQVDAVIGTVSQRLARFQDVCGNRHIYNILHRSQYNFVSDRPGESNFGGVYFTWKPSDKPAEDILGEDEFAPLSGDEFETFDEFSSGGLENSMSKRLFSVKEAGTFFYEEFGMAFHEYKYYSGVFTQIGMPLGFNLKAQFIDQYILNDHALAFYAQIEKEHTWSRGSTSLFDFSYLGKIDIDEGAHFYPAFSNLFAGEIMRLDAIDLPLLQGSVKHYFTGKNKIKVQLNGVRQVNRNHSQELDLIAGIKLLGHVRLTIIGSYLSSEALDNDYWMGKIELRVAF